MSTLSPPPLPPRTPSGKVVGPTTAQSPSPDGGRRVPPALPARPEASSTDPDTVVLVEDKRLVDALSNDELGVLMRRFDKQVGHVYVAPTDPPRISSVPPLLDLQPSPDELFSPDKLRSNLERFYSTVVIGSIRFGKEIMRLRSWDERFRTSAFLVAYALAWYMNVLTASFLSFLSVLILVPSTRLVFFPPIVAPPPADATDPPLTMPGVGLLPEFITERAVGAERMASDFAEGMGALLVSSGTTTAEETGEAEAEGKAQKLAREAGALAEDIDEMTSADGPEISPEERKLKAKQAKKISKKERKLAKKQEKKEKLLDKHGRPVMVIVGDLADGWERWANAFSPTEPFGSQGRRSVVLSIFLPIIISTSGIFSEYVFSRVIGGFVGFLFFGQPILDRIAPFLEEKIPNWQEKMELRNGILAGVPTNAQLSLRILRDAELRLKPLPPPPPPPVEDGDEDDDGTEDESEEFAIVDGANDDTASVRSIDSGATGKVDDAKRTKDKAKVQGKAKLANFIKSAARLTEESAGYLSGQKQVDWEKMSKAALDKLNVSKESGPGKSLLAVVPKTTYPEDTPSTFFLNHNGRPGHIIIHPPNLTTHTPARVVFTTVGNVSAKDNYPLDPEPTVANEGKKGKLVISINDLVEIRKHGIGWQSRMFMNWAIGLQGVGGTGLELKVRRKKTVEVELDGAADDAASVVTRQEEELESFKFGAIVRRDELFNRLIALGDQRWEVL